MKPILIIFSSCLFLLFSCTSVGPDYVAPEIQANAKWKFEADFKLSEKVENNWWEQLNDDELNKLIALSRIENPTIQTAALRILESRAVLGITQGQLWPQKQSIDGSGSINDTSHNAPNSAGADPYFKNYQAGVNIGWEIDFWGKFGRLINASKAQLEAEMASYDNYQILLYSEVASAYVRMRVFEEHLNVATINVAVQQRNMKIAEVQFKNGDVTELDFQQARIIVNNTLSTIPVFEAAIIKAKNAIAVLLGKNPGEADSLITANGKIPSLSKGFAVSAPTSLLRRRPDIRLAERLLATQSELIGVAQADLYPHLSLLGSVGFQTSNSSVTKNGNSSFTNIFSTESLFYSMGPSFSWDVLNYGRIKNRVRAEDARFEQLAENYRKTVLDAQLEVENAMTDFHGNVKSLAYLKESTNAAGRSLKISELLYKNGETPFNRVLDSLQLLLAQENDVVSRKGEVVLNFISIYKGLGGGWEMNGARLPSDKTLERMKKRTDWGDIISSPEDSKQEGNNK